jgi:hypothetical protein
MTEPSMPPLPELNLQNLKDIAASDSLTAMRNALLNAVRYIAARDEQWQAAIAEQPAPISIVPALEALEALEAAARGDEAFPYGATDIVRAFLEWAVHPPKEAEPAPQGVQEAACCVNWEAGTSCFADPKQDCPRLPPMGTAPALMEGPLPMDTAPKDGTMLRLLVQFENCSFDDSNLPCWVCGFNLADNTGEDKWQFPGWSWVHDYILDASDDGKPIGWLPMLATKQAEAPTASNERAQAMDAIEAFARDRYKVAPSHESMFFRFAVVAGDGLQQLYLGREAECQNMAAKFTGAFLDGAYFALDRAAIATQQEAQPQAEPAGGDSLAVLERCKRLFDEALPKFNWGAAFLDANAIALLNEVPAEVAKAIRAARAAQQATGERG